MTVAFRRWAPAARTLAVAAGDARTALVRDDDGVFTGAVALAPGDDYALVVDDDPPLPDPRSPWQPAGVLGPSRHVDHDAFAWTDAGFAPVPLADAVLYELHVGTFTPAGTFDGVVARLDHLVDLGVTHVELMPVHAFPGARGWGYDGVALYAPQDAYGGPAGLKRLVDAAHARGLGVLLDVVYNHLGPVGNVLGRFGPYFTDRHPTPWGAGLNVDGPGADEVRRFVCDNALGWLRDYHVDGLRLDATHAIADGSAVHVLEQLAGEVAELGAALGRSFVVIAEDERNDSRLVRPPERGGYGLDALWSDDLHHALHALLTGERLGYYGDYGTLGDVAAALGRGFVYDGRYAPSRRRTIGRPADGVPADRFVVAAQNHDQVGNRAGGERLVHLVGPARARIAAALVLTSPFVPLLFQGEEWGASSPFLYFTAHDDPALGRAIRDGRRRELAAFGWPDAATSPDPQADATFARSRLDWNERARPEHAALLAWHRALIRLRRTLPRAPAGDGGHARVRCDEDARWLAMQRGDVTIAVNLAGAPRAVPLAAAATSRIALASSDAAALAGDAIVLPPDGVAIVVP